MHTDDIKNIQNHERALDNVLRANVEGRLTQRLKDAAIEAGLRCGLSLRESESFLKNAIEASR
jgi:hypothetical protein